MGLDITAYSNLKHIGKHHDGTYCENEDHIKAFAYASFPRSFRGIPILGHIWEVSGGTPFMDGGCFELTDATKEHRFRAGSYGGYNLWRSNLAQQFNPQPEVPGETHRGEPDPELPFYELIWFADNEGCIGPEAARDLLEDFRAHQSTYVPLDRNTYPDWMLACELAAEGGLIRFH